VTVEVVPRSHICGQSLFLNNNGENRKTRAACNCKKQMLIQNCHSDKGKAFLQKTILSNTFAYVDKTIFNENSTVTVKTRAT
jgi:hypothetical protein